MSCNVPFPSSFCRLPLAILPTPHPLPHRQAVGLLGSERTAILVCFCSFMPFHFLSLATLQSPLWAYSVPYPILQQLPVKHHVHPITSVTNPQNSTRYSHTGGSDTTTSCSCRRPGFSPSPHMVAHKSVPGDFMLSCLQCAYTNMGTHLHVNQSWLISGKFLYNHITCS